jgi:hypothetical protein
MLPEYYFSDQYRFRLSSLVPALDSAVPDVRVMRACLRQRRGVPWRQLFCGDRWGRDVIRYTRAQQV